jgi:hypothetical protein
VPPRDPPCGLAAGEDAADPLRPLDEDGGEVDRQALSALVASFVEESPEHAAGRPCPPSIERGAHSSQFVLQVSSDLAVHVERVDQSTSARRVSPGTRFDANETNAV